MKPTTRAGLEITLAIIIGLAVAITTMLANGCAPELPEPILQAPEERAKNFIRLFTDPNMAPMLRRINDARIDKQIEDLDRERALKSL